jgi:hypothetical protein
MLPSPDSLSSANTKEQLEFIIQLLQSDIISKAEVCRRLGLDRPEVVEMLSEQTYEEKRAHLIDLCAYEETDVKLHNDCVTELLMFMDGGHPAFGNIVGEMCMMCEAEGYTPLSAAVAIMRRCPEYRRPTYASGGGSVIFD